MKSILAFVLFFVSSWTFAQNHVQWNFHYDATSESVIAEGKIDAGWHLYSQKTDENAGPIATKMVLLPNKSVKLIDNSIEDLEPHEIFDKNFESTVYLFETKYRVHQKIKIKKPTTIKGEMHYMICDDTKCLPPISVPFTLEIN
ncbi:MAG: hypothetical protein RLZZ30_1685 [Bacteroidota bacterium]|jgi:thiol:disulfide interchange protein DsbD